MNFETLYQTYESRLRGHAMKLTKNPDYAQDLFQETMLRVWKSWDIFNHHSEPETRAWLFKIMNNLNINAYHRGLKIEFKSFGFERLENGENRRINTREFMTSDLVTKETPERILHNKTIGNKIYNIISNLPSNFKEVAILCFIKNRSYEQIAEILDISVGTVKSKICRSRKLIQLIYSDKKKNKFVFCEKPKTNRDTESKVYHKIRISSARRTYAQCGFVRNNFSSNIVLSHKPPKGRSLCKHCEKQIKKTFKDICIEYVAVSNQ